jgi:hypothetical protein
MLPRILPRMLPSILKMHFALAIAAPNRQDHLDTCGFWHLGRGRDPQINVA